MNDKMLDSITDGPRHPDEDAEMLTEKEEETVASLSIEYIDALEREDNDRLQEIRERFWEIGKREFADITTIKMDEWGFWK